MTPTAEVVYRPITSLVRDPNNREPDDIEGLTESIREVGVLQPILVRPTVADDTWMIVDGERRWSGALAAKLGEVPTICRNPDDREAVVARLVGNLHRRDYKPLELTALFDELTSTYGMTQTAVAGAAGISQPQISKYLKLKDLAPETRDALAAGEVTMTEALDSLRSARAPKTEGGAPDREAGGSVAEAGPNQPSGGPVSPPSQDVGDHDGDGRLEGTSGAPSATAEASEATTSGPVAGDEQTGLSAPSPAPDQHPASRTAVAAGGVGAGGAATGDGAGGVSPSVLCSAPAPDVEHPKSSLDGLAMHVVLDWRTPELRIDGERFPWYMAPEGPRVEVSISDCDLGVVMIPLLVDFDGSITEIGEPGDYERARDAESRAELDAAREQLGAALSPEDLASLAQVEPWPDYETWEVDRVVSELDMPGTTDDLTRHVKVWEEAHGARAEILARCDYHLGDVS